MAIFKCKMCGGTLDAAETEEKKNRTERKAHIAREIKIISAVFAGISAVVITFVIVLNKVIIPNKKYNKAIDLYKNGNYSEARSAFEDLNGYKDSDDYIENCLTVIRTYLSDIRAQLSSDTFSAGSNHTAGLRSDGTVMAVGKNNFGQCDVDHWTDIVAVSAGYEHIVGLKSDSTVVAAGMNYDGQCNVDHWTDIVAVSADFLHTVGLKSDGTVVAVGDNKYGQCDVSNWTDIKTTN